MSNPAVDLGVEMWSMLSGAFYDVAAANGLETPEQRAALWATFLASVAGGMTADLGAPLSQAILDGGKTACQEAMRANLHVVAGSGREAGDV